MATTLTPQRSGAFTLVELLLVLVLIAILSGALVVSLHGRQDTHALRAAANDLAAAIRFAAAEAKLRQCPHRVAFLNDLRAYRVEAATVGETLDFTPTRGQAGIIRSLPRGVELATTCSNANTIEPLLSALTFDAGGSGFFGLIELKSRSGETIAIEVTRETHQIRIVE